MSQAAFLITPLASAYPTGVLPNGPGAPASPEGNGNINGRPTPTYNLNGNDVQPLTWKWAGAWVATWIVLAGLAELDDTRELAAAFAVSAAFAASVLFLPRAKDIILGGLA